MPGIGQQCEFLDFADCQPWAAVPTKRKSASWHCPVLTLLARSGSSEMCNLV